MGKIIDSAIIGVITFVAMTILRLDFAVLISVFIGITNIIPVFGPFIGAIPSVFILLLIDPLQAVIFCVLILIIQQLDGNFIGPKDSRLVHRHLGTVDSVLHRGGRRFVRHCRHGGRRAGFFATLYGLAQEFVHYLLDRRGIDSEGKPVEHEAEDTENVFE